MRVCTCTDNIHEWFVYSLHLRKFLQYSCGVHNQKYYCINCKFYQPKNKNKLRTGVLDSESILKQHILQKLSVPNLYFFERQILDVPNLYFFLEWQKLGVPNLYFFWKYSRMTETGCFKPIFLKVFSNNIIFWKYSRMTGTGCSKPIFFESIHERQILQELGVSKVFSNIAHWKYSVDWTQDLHIAVWK